MSPDAGPAGSDPPSPAVVEWGGDSPTRRPVAAAPRAALRGLATDRRLVPTAAGLGAAAVTLSLISEWQVTVVSFGDAQSTDRLLSAGVADLAGWAAGYLCGLLVLAATMTLLMYGAPAVRRPARLVALSTGGVLLVLLLAMASELDERSRLSSLLELTLRDDQFQVRYGRGVWCALAGVAAVTLAAHLAGRHLPPDPAALEQAPAPAATDPAATDPTGDRWSDEPPDAPLDLTVESTTPFTRPADGRDRLG